MNSTNQPNSPQQRSWSATMRFLVVALVVLLTGLSVWFYGFYKGAERNEASNKDQPAVASTPLAPESAPVSPDPHAPSAPQPGGDAPAKAP